MSSETTAASAVSRDLNFEPFPDLEVACRCSRNRGIHRPLLDLLEPKLYKTQEGCHWTRAVIDEGQVSDISEAACKLADASMRWRCQGAPQTYQLWRDAANSKSRLSGLDRSRVLPFITTAFGSADAPKPVPHLCGWIAEFLWFCISAERKVRGNRELVRLEGPGLHATEPGGDGLAVWSDSASGSLRFCLWEIKNNVGASELSTTIKRAYSQLDDRATEYLAKMTSIAAARDEDPSMRALYAELVDLWVDDSDRSAAGVAVGTHSHKAPKKCFSTMQKYFPGKQNDWQLEGLVVAVPDFTEFSKEVRSHIWSVL